MDVVSRARRLETEDLMGGIRDTSHQINLESSTPLIKDLRMEQIFEDETKEEGASVIDLVLSALRLLREDIREVVDSMEPVKLQDKGQPSHVVDYKYVPNVLMY